MREDCSGVTCSSLIGCGSLQVISVVTNTSFSTCREVFIVGMDVFVYREFCGNYCSELKKILQ